MSGGEISSPNFKLSVYAELKPQLASAQIFLKILQDCYRRKVTLNVKKTSVEVKWSKKNVHELLFQGVCFVPTTCHSMQWVTKNQLHFRVQVFDKERTNGHLICEPNQRKDLLKPFQGEDFACFCIKCGQTVIEQQRFSRVLPLPSDNWYELADSLFCCKHKHTSTPEKQRKQQNETEGDNSCEVEKEEVAKSVGLSLQPKEGDCLVGETHFMVHGTSVMQQNIDVNKVGGNVVCARCRFVLGQNVTVTEQKNGCVRPKCKVSAVKFFNLNVSISEEAVEANITVENIPKSPSLSLEHSLADLLVNHSKQYNCYRIVIEAKQQHKIQPYVLIWMLDYKCYQYVGETSSDSQESKQCTVKSQEVVKLMYKDCLRKQNASISDSWCKDLTVHSIELPADTCMQLLDILIENTKKLPNSMAVQNIDGNNFYVGYLEKMESIPKVCDSNDVNHTRTD